MKFLSFRTGIFFILSLFVVSCNEENPLLVNPPSKAESVRVRYINLGYDRNIKTLDMNGLRFENVQWNTATKSFQPNADSAFLKVFYNGSIEFELEQQVKFLRNTNYTFISLTRYLCPEINNCKTDTIIALRTTAALPDNPNYALVKFVNAFPDTNFRYFLRLGCPSGENLFPSTNYLQYSLNPALMKSGETSISLIKVPVSGLLSEIVVNVYKIKVEGLKQYAVVLHSDTDSKETLSLLNENDLSENSFTPMQIVSEREARLRTINLSSVPVDIGKIGDDIISQGIIPFFADKYKNMNACKTTDKDTLLVFSNLSETSRNISSLNVSNDYTILVFDSLEKKAAESILIEPASVEKSTAGKSIIRVVNAAKSFPSTTTALGARYESDVKSYPFAYSSGTILASKLKFGDISEPVVLSPGSSPFNIFTGTEPAKLLFSAKGILEADKSYVLVIMNNENGGIQLALIDDKLENSNISYLDEGVFVQIVNGYSSSSEVQISINSKNGEPMILDNAKVNFSNSIATVIDKGTQTIVVNGISYDINAEVGKRNLVIATGDKNGVRIISDKFEQFINNENSLMRFRFVNASDIPFVKIKKNSTDSVYVESVEKDFFSSYQVENKERKINYFFYNGDNANFTKRINDVLFTLGKSYSIILTGIPAAGCQLEYDKNQSAKEPNCYFVIIQQEF